MIPIWKSLPNFQGSFSFRQNRPQMTRMGRIFSDLIRVAPLDPPAPRSIARQTGKRNGPANFLIDPASYDGYDSRVPYRAGPSQ